MFRVRGACAASLIAVAGGAAASADGSAGAAERSSVPPRFMIAEIRPGASVAVRSGPGGAVAMRLGSRTEFGSRRALAVAVRRGRWLGVRASELGNGRLGWIDARARGLAYAWTAVRLEIDLSRRELRLHRGDRVTRLPVSIGRTGSPTPIGRFAVTDKLPGARFSPVYGCCILALSGRQPRVPAGWRGGDRLAIHGSPGDAVGRRASAGCLQARRDDLGLLMRTVPLGAPVVIHP